MDKRKPPSKKDEDKATRNNFDKRSLRLMHVKTFVAGIDTYLNGNWISNLPAEGLQQLYDAAPIKVYVRKRPMFEKEAGKKEFDVVSVSPVGPVLVHNCLFRPDQRHAYLANYLFPVKCYPETATNDMVCRDSGVDEMISLACFGGQSTICMFGQTGSGKSHTMSGILHRTADFIFNRASPARVLLAAFEVYGKMCGDLLNKAEKITPKEDKNGVIQVITKEVELTCVEQFDAWITKLKSLRKTSSTQKNSTSSRSHMFYQFTVINDGALPGRLTLVDLAGSERGQDSMYHDAETQRESNAINASLSVLKDCLRLRNQPNASKLHIPYRESLITMILREALESDSPNNRLMVIATVSPCCSDTEHTMNTLKHAINMTGFNFSSERDVMLDEFDLQMLDEADGTPAGTPKVTHPWKWSDEDLRSWLGNVGGGKYAPFMDNLPAAVDGKALKLWPELRWKQLCGDNEKRGAALLKLYKEEVSSANMILKGK